MATTKTTTIAPSKALTVNPPTTEAGSRMEIDEEELGAERQQNGGDVCDQESDASAGSGGNDRKCDEPDGTGAETAKQPEAATKVGGEGVEETVKDLPSKLHHKQDGGRDGRSQYHSIQRLLSPIGRTANRSSVTGGCASGCSPGASSSSSLDYTLAPGYFVGKDASSYYHHHHHSHPHHHQPDSLKVLQGLLEQQASAMMMAGAKKDQDGIRLPDESSGKRENKEATRKNWSEGGAVKDDEMEDRSVEVSTNDFMDSMEDNDSIRSPPTDLSNSSAEDEEDEAGEEDEEELSDAEKLMLRETMRDRSEERGDRDGDAMMMRVFAEDAASFSDSAASIEDTVHEAKRARMEFIVTNMKRSPSSTSNEINQPERLGVTGANRPKRKQYIPKQHDSCRQARVYEAEREDVATKMRAAEKEELEQELMRMQERLTDMKEKYFQIFGNDCSASRRKESDSERTRPEVATGSSFLERAACVSPFPGASGELKHLAGMLKAEISNTVGSLVDEIVKSFMQKYRPQSTLDKSVSPSERDPDSSTAKIVEKSALDVPPHLADKPADAAEEEVMTPPDTKPQPFLHPPAIQNLMSSSSSSSSSLVLPQPLRPQPGCADFSGYGAFPSVIHSKQAKSKMADKYIHPFFDHASHQSKAFDVPRAHLQLFPQSFYPHPQQVPVMAAAAMAAAAAGMFAKGGVEPEQTEAIPLIVNTPAKKKRTKVTDTRLSPRAARAILQENGQTNHRSGANHLTRDDDQVAKQQSAAGQMDDGRKLDRRASSTNDDPEPETFFGQFRSSQQQQQHNPYHHHHHHHHLPPLRHPLLSVTLPTSVAIPNPSLQHSDIIQAIYGPHKAHHRLDLGGLPGSEQRFSGAADLMAALPGRLRSASSSPEMAQKSSDGFSGSMIKADSMDNYENSVYDDHALTSTLTPMHLRKAKLMFFYVRYPSSSILKVYFPDVKFNKNNTAQLIKWFSNFREFYYIQMEKYARQALAEGVKNPSDIVVTCDSELYRVLVLHYNRNNRIEVPDSFRQTVQATLREFFKSIQGEKDQEPSWKKAIYKIIAHLDDTVPEYFKSPNWMEQLADG